MFDKAVYFVNYNVFQRLVNGHTELEVPWPWNKALSRSTSHQMQHTRAFHFWRSIAFEIFDLVYLALQQ